MMLPRRALAGCAAALLALTACSDPTQADDRSPEEVLADAKAVLDQTSGVRLELSTEELPPTVDGILRAEGIGTHDPAFEGELTVASSGITADVPVVAAQGKVFAKLPFTTEFVEVDPTSYGAPDPAALMEPDNGLSSLLTEAEDVEAGKQVRSGEEVLATYSGTVPGQAVASIIPSATPSSEFAATFTVDDDDQVREARLTGPFYPDAREVTYTITFDEYGIAKDITLP